MSTTSPFLQLVLQALDENPDTWGEVLNVSALELLEDAIAGTAAVPLISAADYTLDDTVGGPSETDSSRFMILNVTGSPGGATNIICPTRSKVYLAANNTSDASSIVVKTAAGTGITVSPATAIWVYCDGTNVLAASVDNAQTATTATTATDSTQLGGVAAAGYGKLSTQQTWTAGQAVERVVLTASVGNITPDVSASDSFYALWDGNYQLAAPIGSPVNGQRFSIIAQQDNPATPNTISFAASTYIFEGGTLPTLSTGNSAVDYLAFEYCTDLVGGARWVGSIMKGLA
jgi:hypothetical protein